MLGKILLVDDDAFLRRTLTLHLEQAGYRVAAVGTAEQALREVERLSPDLVILDIGLPGMDGFDALQRFKEHSQTPIIFLTARRRNLDQILGLQLGADDYIIKPFDIDVLLARVHTILRRTISTSPILPSKPNLQIGGLHISLASHTVNLHQTAIQLTPKEFDLLYALALKPDQVVSINDLLIQIWGIGYEGQPQAVYVHLRALRQKIEADPTQPQRIVSVRGVGYKLVSEAW